MTLRLNLCTAIAVSCAVSCGHREDSKPSGEVNKEAQGTSQTEPSVSGTAAFATAKVPVRLPGKMTPAPWLEGATRVVAMAKSAGEATPVIVAAGLGWMRWFDSKGKKLGERSLSGSVQVLEVVDLDGDGAMAVLVGSGRGRDAVAAPIALEIVRLNDAGLPETLPLPATTRAQVVSAVPAPGLTGQIWVASYVSKFEVAISRFARGDDGKWSLAESRGKHRVVGGMTILKDDTQYGTPVIARMYGKDADTPGGVYELVSETAQVTVPSVRGARALLAIPWSSQSWNLVVADGWHKHYAKRAQGLVSFVSKSALDDAGEGWSLRHRLHVKDNYGFQRLRVGKVHSNPGFDIVASGNGPAIVVLPQRPELLFSLADVEAVDAFPINLDGDSRTEVVIVGPNPAIWSPL
ncbi:MAG: hypothetical protein JKY56_00980 [Kofleriaceae bacterium]|nr:hypothetical protein [Kofleriaceae bacterium]